MPFLWMGRAQETDVLNNPRSLSGAAEHRDVADAMLSQKPELLCRDVWEFSGKTERIGTYLGLTVNVNQSNLARKETLEK